MAKQVKLSARPRSESGRNSVKRVRARFGGLFEQSVRAISVRCLPQNLPEIITVDVSALKIGESIHIRDIKLPAGVTIEDNADLTVFIVAEPSVAAEPAAASATSPEVIKEKKAAGSEEKK
jgi:large subunit ribosomal protein L25